MYLESQVGRTRTAHTRDVGPAMCSDFESRYIIKGRTRDVVATMQVGVYVGSGVRWAGSRIDYPEAKVGVRM